MQSDRFFTAIKVLILAGFVAFAIWLLSEGISRAPGQSSPPVAGVPLQVQDAPFPVPTEPPGPNITPTQPEPSATPTHVSLQAPIPVIPSSVAQLTQDPDVVLTEEFAVTTTEQIHAMTWAPTGDKLVYVTYSGNVYSVNIDGTNPTLLLTYPEDRIWALLDEQRPLGNALLLPGHAIHFTQGQPPTVNDSPDTLGVWQIRWWSRNRASGIAGNVVSDGYDGGERLVTLDTDGKRVEERNIPYMWSGAVRPGGDWLAYATNQQSGSTPFDGSDPQTAYLLNLNTGQRLQITDSRTCDYISNWSPDGSWFLIAAVVGDALRGVLVSADGSQWLTLPAPGNGGGDAVWSPDSKRLAFSIQSGGRDDPNGPDVPYDSKVYIVDVRARKFSLVDIKPSGGRSANTTGLMMQPKWSPDGSRLALLSYDSECAPKCSGLSPAYHIVDFPK